MSSCVIVVGVRVNSDPADIAQLAVIEFEPAETQPVVGRVQLGEPLPVLALNASRSVRA